MSEAAARFSLRDLPLPAKLVITCFLLAVGGGYYGGDGAVAHAGLEVRQADADGRTT